MVGKVIATKMAALGHDTYMGTRNPGETKQRKNKDGQTFQEWLDENPQVKLISFDNLPDSDLYINATNGQVSVSVLASIANKLNEKVILDLANAFDYSNGMPPALAVCNTDSLGEQIQSALPESYVVKSLNTMNCNLMMNPDLVTGDHTVFVSGNNDAAKEKVTALLEEIGWKAGNIIDLGDITTSRGTEMLLPIWLRLWGKLGTAAFNFHIVMEK